MENYFETSIPIKISLPQGVIAPNNGVPAQNVKLPLTAVQLEQVKKALKSGEKLIQTRLNRLKRTSSRCTAQIEENTVKSAIVKAERVKPVQIYLLEVLDVELEAIIYCLERSKNSKGKDLQQLIASLSAYFDYEG